MSSADTPKQLRLKETPVRFRIIWSTGSHGKQWASLPEWIQPMAKQEFRNVLHPKMQGGACVDPTTKDIAMQCPGHTLQVERCHVLSTLA
eukprot:5417958-Amphidinium_carterae.1